VVDDNPATMYATTRVLRAAGWATLEATTGTEAVALATPAVDLVILDIDLPDFDGFEVCRRLREHESTAAIPIVHLSATFVRDVDKVQGLQGGASGYLTHPVEPPVLIATVNAFLRGRQAERRLRQSEESFRAVFENAVNGIAMFDTEGRISDANPALCRMCGLSHEQLVGSQLIELMRSQERSPAEQLRELRAQDSWRMVVPWQRPDNEKVWLEWSVSRHAGPHFWLAIASDITDRVRLEKQREDLLESERQARADAERANRLKDEFLATLSHELRTPLHSIVGWSEVLRRASTDAELVREGVAAIERNARAQSQMVGDLLDISRIAAGKVRLEAELLEFGEIVSAAVASVKVAASAKGITLQDEWEPAHIMGDRGRLHQVVANLLTNAIKFTPRSGEIWVQCRRAGDEVILRIRDTGQGMSGDLLPTIFERFRQGDGSSSRTEGGLGLGLAIVKQLVELHGGRVWAESPGTNLGSTFSIAIPLAKEMAPSAHAHAKVPPALNPTRLEGVRILIVDDDRDAREVLKRLLGDCGGVINTAASVQEAMHALAGWTPQILVSDLGMPEKDGFELIARVREVFSEAELPAVAVTAFAQDKDRRRALSSGYQAHFAKPIEVQELVASIRALVETEAG
jgi:hypothetical protein